MQDELLTFRDQICNLINTTQLPFSAKFYVLKDVMAEVEECYNQYFAQRQQEQGMMQQQASAQEGDNNGGEQQDN